MYRAYVYYAVNSNIEDNVRLTSTAWTTETFAVGVLNHLLELPGFSGGGIERHEDGIGWVISD